MVFFVEEGPDHLPTSPRFVHTRERGPPKKQLSSSRVLFNNQFGIKEFLVIKVHITHIKHTKFNIYPDLGSFEFELRPNTV